MATYLGINRKGMSNYFDHECGSFVDVVRRTQKGLEEKTVFKQQSLFIHHPSLVLKPAYVGPKTREALANAILKEYDAQEAVRHLNSSDVKASISQIESTLTREDYEMLFGGEVVAPGERVEDHLITPIKEPQSEGETDANAKEPEPEVTESEPTPKVEAEEPKPEVAAPPKPRATTRRRGTKKTNTAKTTKYTQEEAV
jgi:hypothetical protein